jgi:hypothetical protein
MLGMGAHWAILQSVAWTEMVITYSRHASLREALEKTFDGKHPCKLCRMVKAGRKSERNQNRRKVSLKLDPFNYGAPVQTLFPPSLETVWTRFLNLYCWSKDPPPTPPPLLA